MKKVVFCALLGLFAAKMQAQESQTGYNFLRLPVSAHAAALGGDNVSLTEDDGTLMFHNPALLSGVSDKTLNLNYMSYMQGSKTASASFNRVVKEKASWAVSAQYVDYGKMKETDEDNNVLGDFSSKDIAIGGYFSYLLANRLTGGITLKFISSYIGSYNSIGVGVDLGLNYFDPKREWSLSFVAKNLGGQLSAYDEEFDKMPIDIQMGVSKRVTNTPFRLSATLVNLNDWNYSFLNHAVIGADILLGDNVWVGGGYNFKRAHDMKIQASSEEKGSSHRAGLTLGGGINLVRFHLNIAYGKYHVSSSSLIFNVGYSL